MAKTSKETRYSYPNITVRISRERKKWLCEERKKYKSWNLLFEELQKRYVSMQQVPRK